MNNNKRIEEEVIKTLQYLERNETIDPGPFFYTRLQARINDLHKPKASLFDWLFGVQWVRPALIALLILVNVFSVFKVIQWVSAKMDSRNENLTAFAQSYSLTPDSVTVYIQYPNQTDTR